MEHPFGTIKRQWGFNHIVTKKTINRASSDVGLIFIAYNLKRILKLKKGVKIIYYKGNPYISRLIALIEIYSQLLIQKVIFEREQKSYNEISYFS